MDNTTADQVATRVSEEEAPHDLHGNSPAAWTAVTIVLIAFTVGAIAMVLGPNWVLFWISVAIAVLGALTGKVMQLLGFGVPADGNH
ncbi:HGxxPAAW family protein [Kribbella sp. NPDC051952]|uniref:HGxxPAAW family protein n=1 Tax=Kribbella sp. NPDC051952 TaxID=3154851 RepID=UPI003432A12F